MVIEERMINDVVVAKVHGDIVLNGSSPALAERVRSLLDQDRVASCSTWERALCGQRGISETRPIVQCQEPRRDNGLARVTRHLHDLPYDAKLLNVFSASDGGRGHRGFRGRVAAR